MNLILSIRLIFKKQSPKTHFKHYLPAFYSAMLAYEGEKKVKMHDSDLQGFIIFRLKAILFRDNANKRSCMKLRFSRRARIALLFLIQSVSCCRNILRLLRKLIALPETCGECSFRQDRSRSTSPLWQPCQKASEACLLCDHLRCYPFSFPHWHLYLSVKRVCVAGVEFPLGRTYNRHQSENVVLEIVPVTFHHLVVSNHHDFHEARVGQEALCSPVRS